MKGSDQVKEAAARYPSGKTRLTYEDYRQLPAGLRYELVEGDLRMMSSPGTRHQEISKRLLGLFLEQIEKKGLGKVYQAPYDVILSEHNVVQPDLLFVSRDRLGIITPENVQGAPDLVVEILSESTQRWDRETKRRIYARYGVREMWIVDPAAEIVEVAAHNVDNLVTAGIYGPGTDVSSPLLPQIKLNPADLLRA